MKVILNENVEGLGGIGELVNVKPGYARNFLLPRNKAVVADEKNVKEFEHQKRQAERKLEKLTAEAASLKDKVEGVSCTVVHRAGDDGKLFGSVTNIELAEKLAEAGLDIDRKQIVLLQPIKSLGEHEVPVKLNAGVTATLKVVVEASEEE
ncbi:MAG: 50S ribosomal protein L9 [Desulfuromonas sp.]|nr:MAG: 50S ribosomal protein L9 [Desulfuromonas sp.]